MMQPMSGHVYLLHVLSRNCPFPDRLCIYYCPIVGPNMYVLYFLSIGLECMQYCPIVGLDLYVLLPLNRPQMYVLLPHSWPRHVFWTLPLNRPQMYVLLVHVACIGLLHHCFLFVNCRIPRINNQLASAYVLYPSCIPYLASASHHILMDLSINFDKKFTHWRK